MSNLYSVQATCLMLAAVQSDAPDADAVTETYDVEVFVEADSFAQAEKRVTDNLTSEYQELANLVELIGIRNIEQVASTESTDIAQILMFLPR